VVKLFVEGGGDSNQLKTECRRGFSSFFEKAGLKGKMPRIVACGSRQDAYNDFVTALNSNEDAMLLVDSEQAVDASLKGADDYESWKPWEHLARREGDNWNKPNTATNTHCHLMVQCMENWFLADRQALKDFFGVDFKENQLPSTSRPIEEVDKSQVYDSLAKATKDCQKGSYGKGAHSFKILQQIDPQKVTAAAPWAKRCVAVLKEKMGVSESTKNSGA
jgi:Domain of unknown function (DUF4276)